MLTKFFRRWLGCDAQALMWVRNLWFVLMLSSWWKDSPWGRCAPKDVLLNQPHRCHRPPVGYSQESSLFSLWGSHSWPKTEKLQRERRKWCNQWPTGLDYDLNQEGSGERSKKFTSLDSLRTWRESLVIYKPPSQQRYSFLELSFSCEKIIIKVDYFISLLSRSIPT